MRKAFNFRFETIPDEIQNSPALEEKDKSLIYSKIVEMINSCTDNDGIIDGSILSEQWFPSIEADVFISHSHKDEETALKLASFLEHKKKIKAFVDSSVWGNCTKLKEYFYSKSNIFGYPEIDDISSKVNMLVCMALQEMIYKTENIIFLNTENSTVEDAVGKAFTLSPWISYEISFANILLAIEQTKSQNFSENLSNGLQMKHELKLARFKDVDSRTFSCWAYSNPANFPGSHKFDLLEI